MSVSDSSNPLDHVIESVAPNHESATSKTTENGLKEAVVNL